ncbi:MAG: hypothetical protein ACRC1Z_18480 [Waterburya sp.]
MINIFLAFMILSIAMYLAIKVVNLVNARFNILPKPDKIRTQTKIDIAVETSANSLQVVELGEFSSPNIFHTVNPGEIDAGTVASEVVTNAEGLAEGVQTLVESAGETLTTLVEGLSHH